MRVIPVVWWFLKKTLRNKVIPWERIMRWCCCSSLYLFCKEIMHQNFAIQCKWFQYIYRPQRSWAKVIFSQACVILSTGGGSASVHAGIYPPRTRPPRQHQTLPPRDQTPPAPIPHPGTRPPPPGSRLQHTVNERPVRILLECILVMRANDLSFQYSVYAFAFLCTLPTPLPPNFTAFGLKVARVL